MSDVSRWTSGGIDLGGATFLVFLILKLTGHIDWSWWWVTAPLWMPFAALALFGCLLFLIGCFLYAVEKAFVDRL